MKVIAIVQARMGSTRLPGKMTKEILGKPIVEYVFDRVRPSKRLTEIWLATTTDTSDDVLAEWAKNHGVKCYRGSMNDVLDRYYQTAKLEKAWQEARLSSEREHVTPYIWKHPEIFKIKNIFNDVDLSGLRWTLDTEEDFAFILLIIERIAAESEYPYFQKILEIIREHPEWKNINAGYKRNEGYQKSINNDPVV